MTAHGAFWGSGLALDWEGGRVEVGAGDCAVRVQSVRPDPPRWPTG